MREEKRRLKNWLDSYMQYVEESEPPRLFHLWTAIGIISSIMQRKCWLNWEKQTYPNFYIVLVGSSGLGKGTAFMFGKRVLNNIVKPSSDTITREALIGEIEELEQTSILSDGTQHTHCSVLVFAAEFAVFIGYENKQLIADLTDLFDCPDVWTYRTKGSGTNRINNAFITLIGGTTPAQISDMVMAKAIGIGLTGRMILVYENEIYKPVPYPWKMMEAENQKLEEDLIHDLECIHALNGEFKVSEDFFEQWGVWYENDQKSVHLIDDERFDGYNQRRRKHLLKLAMIFSAVRSDEKIITLEDFERALALLDRTERRMKEAFQGVGLNTVAALMTKLLTTLSMNQTMRVSDIARRFYHDADQETLERALGTLILMKAVKRKQMSDGNDIFEYVGMQIGG